MYPNSEFSWTNGGDAERPPATGTQSMTEGLRTQRPATAWSSTSVGRANEKQGSFSTVSRPNLATKYGFESSRRDLHNALKCTPLHSSVISFFSQNFANFCKIVRNLMKFSKLAKFLKISANFGKILAIFFEKNVLLELCKGVHCVDLGESFYLQNLVSIQPRTSPGKSDVRRSTEITHAGGCHQSGTHDRGRVVLACFGKL